MIQWIQDHKWLPSIFTAVTLLAIFGSIDYLEQGWMAFGMAVLFAIGLSLVRWNGWVPAGLIVASQVIRVVFEVRPALGAVILIPTIILAAMFRPKAERSAVFLVSAAAGLWSALDFATELRLGENSLGLIFANDQGRFTVMLVASLMVLSVTGLSHLYGRLAITRFKHIGTPMDRAVAEVDRATLDLRLREQEERFAIARDVNELIIQNVSGVISQAEGGLYAAKTDPASSIRTLERIANNARQAHVELRRLNDMLNQDIDVASSPPGLLELEHLVVAYREFGYNVVLRNEGEPFEINEGAELMLYRIAFDALENVRSHTPVGTNVTVDLSWVGDGLQLLIKDNGVEVTRRVNAPLEAQLEGYTAEDDHRALVEPIDGPALFAMRERAALYGGSVDATRVAGVGFTVSAIFPSLRRVASLKNANRD